MRRGGGADRLTGLADLCYSAPRLRGRFPVCVRAASQRPPPGGKPVGMGNALNRDPADVVEGRYALDRYRRAHGEHGNDLVAGVAGYGVRVRHAAASMNRSPWR